MRRKTDWSGPGFALALALLAAIALCSVWTLADFRASSLWISRTHALLAALAETERHLLVRQTGMRGYALGGDQRLLKIHAQGGAGVRESLPRLARLAADDRRQAAQIAEIGRLAAEQERWNARLQAARESSVPREAARLVGTRAGERLTERLREKIGELERAEGALLAARATRLAAAWRRTLLIIGAGTAACLGLLLFVFVRLRGEVARREESETRLDLAVESAQMGVWDLDVRADRSVRTLRHDQIFGYATLLPVWGVAQFMPHVPPEHRAAARACLEEGARTGVFRMETPIIRADGARRWIYAAGRAYRGPDGALQRMMGVVMDVTERKEAEERLAAMTRELGDSVSELAAANKELETFSYSVSHDLRSPLRAIDGFSRILLEESGDRLDAEGLRMLGVIRGNTRRMGELIDDLLALSRLSRQAMRRAQIDMTALAASVYEDVGSACARRLPPLKLGALPPAWGDPPLVRQVLTNLLSNAVKYSSRAPAPAIEVGGSIEGGLCGYFVKDNGAGFDMRYAGKLFGVFQRLHTQEEFEGTGVGLAIVQRLVHRHGGRVWAEGRPGEGATFHFTLPAPGGAA